MDNLSQHPGTPEQPATAQPVVIPNTAATVPQQAEAPKRNFTDADAQAILAMHNLQNNGDQRKGKSHLGLFITIIAVVLLTLFASYMLNTLKPAGKTNATSSGSNASATTDTTNQINQDVKSCSNLSTAVSQC